MKIYTVDSAYFGSRLFCHNYLERSINREFSKPNCSVNPLKFDAIQQRNLLTGAPIKRSLLYYISKVEMFPNIPLTYREREKEISKLDTLYIDRKNVLHTAPSLSSTPRSRDIQTRLTTELRNTAEGTTLT